MSDSIKEQEFQAGLRSVEAKMREEIESELSEPKADSTGLLRCGPFKVGDKVLKIDPPRDGQKAWVNDGEVIEINPLGIVCSVLVDQPRRMTFFKATGYKNETGSFIVPAP